MRQIPGLGASLAAHRVPWGLVLGVSKGGVLSSRHILTHALLVHTHPHRTHRLVHTHTPTPTLSSHVFICTLHTCTQPTSTRPVECTLGYTHCCHRSLPLQSLPFARVPWFTHTHARKCSFPPLFSCPPSCGLPCSGRFGAGGVMRVGDWHGNANCICLSEFAGGDVAQRGGGGKGESFSPPLQDSRPLGCPLSL